MSLTLPQKIGSRVRIPNDYDWRRNVEARGFFPEMVTPQYCIMRRDYSDGVLKPTDPNRGVTPV